MSTGFTGRKALIVGSRGALGEGLRDALLAAGASVVGCSRSAVPCADPNYSHVCCDISDESSITALFAELDRRQWRADLAVINAAVASSAMLALSPASEIGRVIGTNVLGNVVVMREVVKRMLRIRGGRIVVISSIRVSKPVRGSSLYGMSKAALEHLVRQLPTEMGNADVTVNAIEIPLLETGMAEAMSAAARNEIVQSLARGRLCEFADVWNAVGFFLRPESSFITGQVLKLGFV